MKDDVIKDSASTTTTIKATNNDKKLRTINPATEEEMLPIYLCK
jgi:hypothetical protein